MLSSIFRLAVLLSFGMTFASAVNAQEVDPQSPADGATVVEEQSVALAVVGETPPLEPVLATCGVYPDNICLDPTQNYLDELATQNLPADEYSQALADLVIGLVPLVPSGEECGLVPSEVPASIRLAAAQATDPEQAARFITLAETIEACTDFQTAAIAPPASPN